MRIIYLVILIILLFSVSSFTNEPTGKADGNRNVNQAARSEVGQGEQITLIENVIFRLEELEDQYIKQLSKKQRNQAKEILDEIYTMLSFLPPNIDLPLEDAAALRSAIEATSIDLNTSKREQQASKRQQDQSAMELQRMEEIAKLVRFPMSDNDFLYLLTSLERERFWEDQIRMIRLTAQNAFFTVEQIIKIVGTFYFFEDQQEVLRVMYPRVTDPQNAYQIPNAFNFYSDRYAIERIITKN